MGHPMSASSPCPDRPERMIRPGKTKRNAEITHQLFDRTDALSRIGYIPAAFRHT